MLALLIDPFTRTLQAIDLEGSKPNDVRKILDVTSFEIQPMGDENHLILGLGLHEKPGMRFWAFQGGEPIAGRALIRGNSRDGLKVQPTSVDTLLIERIIEWPAVAFDGWSTVAKYRALTDQERDVAPQALPAPEEKPQDPPAGKPWSIWTITENDDGYRAAHVAVDGQGNAKHTGTVLENEDLDELRALLPPGLEHRPRTPTDDPAIVETWMTPVSHQLQR